MPRFDSEDGGFLGGIETNRQTAFEPDCPRDGDDDNYNGDDDDAGNTDNAEYGSAYPERRPYDDNQPRRRLRTRHPGKQFSFVSVRFLSS